MRAYNRTAVVVADRACFVRWPMGVRCVPALVAAAVIGLAAMPALAAPLSAQLGAGPTYPSPMTVGQTYNVDLSITNTSGSPENGGGLRLDQIYHTPSCKAFDIGCTVAADQDAGVFKVNGPGTGAANTKCSGVSFTIQNVQANGRFKFVPASTVVLDPPGTPNGADKCRILFTVTVLTAPTGSNTTFPSAEVAATALINNAPGTGSGSTPISIPDSTRERTAAPALSPASLVAAGVLLLTGGLWLVRRRGTR